MILADFLPLGKRVKNGDLYLLDKHLASIFIVVLLKVKLFSCAVLCAQLSAFSSLDGGSQCSCFISPFNICAAVFAFQMQSRDVCLYEHQHFQLYFPGRNVMSTVSSPPPAISGQPEIVMLRFGPPETL